jgi:hypothetical protein
MTAINGNEYAWVSTAVSTYRYQHYLIHTIIILARQYLSTNVAVFPELFMSMMLDIFNKVYFYIQKMFIMKTNYFLSRLYASIIMFITATISYWNVNRLYGGILIKTTSSIIINLTMHKWIHQPHTHKLSGLSNTLKTFLSSPSGNSMA